MEIGICRCKIDQHTDVPKLNITPAEALLLRVAFEPKVQTNPIDGLKLVGNVERTKQRELARLKGKYPNLTNPQNKKQSLVEKLFPSHLTIPLTFAEASPDGGWTELPKAEAEECTFQNYTPGLEDKVEDTELDELERRAEEELARKKAEEGQTEGEPVAEGEAAAPQRRRR